MVILVGRDRGPGAVLNNLLMCIGSNQGIGSLRDTLVGSDDAWDEATRDH